MSYKEEMLQPGALKGKAAMITGGGSGLGKSMGRYFAKLGADLAIIGRNEEKLEKAAKEIEGESGQKVYCYPADVRDYERLSEVVEQAGKDLPHLSILVNNAAGNFISPSERLSHRAFDAVVDIVLKGTFYTTQLLAKHWIARKMAGTVLSITTTYAWTGSPYVVPSACAKAGVLAMTRSLAVEWSKYKIRLNAIAPGPFPTEGAWSRLMPGGLAEKFDPKKIIPVGRYGEHQELANLAAYLVSDYSAFINGEVVTIDGGEWLQGAGEFSPLLDLPEVYWDQLEAQVKRSRKK